MYFKKVNFQFAEISMRDRKIANYAGSFELVTAGPTGHVPLLAIFDLY